MAQVRPRNHGPLLLLAAVLVQGLLLGMAALQPSLPRLHVGGDTLGLRFPALERVLTLKAPTNGQGTDALKGLLAGTKALPPADSDLPDTAQNPEFTNPRHHGRKALDAFFEAVWLMQQGKGPGTVHVAHYGDSQIEGDRITNHLRRSLQQHFGGAGIGYVPLLEPVSHLHLVRSHSRNWVRNTVFQERAKHPWYGMGGTVFSFGPPRPDSAAADSASTPATPPSTVLQAWVDVELRYAALPLLQLAWGKSPGGFRVRLKVNDAEVWTDSLSSDAPFVLTNLPIPAGERHFRLEFEAAASPLIYGLIMGAGGVQVDNFALRGHSGEGLRRINPGSLVQQATQLNTRLIVLHYGGNAVPSTDVKDWTFFEDETFDLIQRFQRLLPDASILVVGVADAARKVEGEYVSYETVPKIRAAQRKAAARAGVAFWDLLEVMGGPGSIIDWVSHKPPYAAQDFAHFSPAGQKLIAERLARLIIREYDAYLPRRERQEALTATPTAQSLP